LKELIREAYDRHKDEIRETVVEPIDLDDYFLHATLWSSSHVPPIAIELILELFPSAIHKKEPGTGLYPLHIALHKFRLTLLCRLRKLFRWILLWR